MLIALVLSLVTLTATPLPAGAAPQTLEVTISGVVVAGHDATSVLTVNASVTNRNTFPVYDVQVALWRSTARLHSLSVVMDALQATETPAGGVPMGGPNQRVTLGPPLQPGQTTDLTLSAPLGELNLDVDASYWVGANVSGGTTPGAKDVSARGRALATVAGSIAPTIVRVVDLTSTPTLLRPNLFADDSLATDLTGRLSHLLSAAATPGASWVIDPALYAAVADMADGYRVVDGEGSRKGTGQVAAEDFLTRLAALDQGAGYRSLFGRPDLVGAFASRAPQVLDRAQAATSDSGLRLPTLAVASRLSPDALAGLRSSRTTVISPATGTTPWATANGASLVGATPLTSPVTSSVLGDSAGSRAAALTALARAVGVQVRLLGTDGDLIADAAASPAWLGHETLAALIATQPKAVGAPSPVAAPGELTASTCARLHDLADAFSLYGSAAPTSGMGAVADAQSSRAASEAWLDDASGRLAYLDALERRSDVRSGVPISATKNVTMSSESSQFPATVTNDLADPITIRVAGYSDNSIRLRISSSELVTIQPNDSETVLVTARATANGVVPATLFVEAADGRRLGDAVTVNVEATNLGIVGWIIVAVSGVGLALSTALRIRQVRRKRSPS